MCRQGCGPGESIVDRMRDQIKKAPPRNDRFDINEAIEEVIEMVRIAIERTGFDSYHAAGVAVVSGDRVQLQQVVMNLILNSVEAMSSVEDDARELSISTRQGQTNEILVAVLEFSGPGIDPEHLDRIFVPFYTTKSTGVRDGTFSICRSIIAAHRGRFWVDANRPRGAIFQFSLPAGLERFMNSLYAAFGIREPSEGSVRGGRHPAACRGKQTTHPSGHVSGRPDPGMR